MSSIVQRRKGLLIGIGIGVGVFLLFLPNLPWVRPELTSEATVIRLHEDGSCEVETEFSDILTVWDCKQHNVGDKVIVKYRQNTALGEITTASPNG